MSVLDDLLGSKKPQTSHVDVCLDPDVGEAFVAARRAHQRALAAADASPDDTNLGAAAAEAEDAYNAALVAVKGSTVRITFHALDPTVLDRLKSEHAPTEQQRRDAQRAKEPMPEWNVDTFPPKMIAAACLRVEGPSGEQVGMSVEDAERLWTSENYNGVERAEIFNTALQAQIKATRLGDIPFG